MPPTRRSRISGGPATKGSQKTLSFSNKITKQTTPSTKDQKILHPKATAEIDVGHVSSIPAVTQQAKLEISSLKTEELEKALKVSDAQIKRYWRECEKSRRAPRVHQEALNVEEKILRLFDMSSQYGVSTFILQILLSCELDGSTSDFFFGMLVLMLE
jgi:DNA polymerase delta subunit 4